MELKEIEDILDKTIQESLEINNPVIENKLKRWCDTLLDLTKRNPSIHFATRVKAGKNKGKRKNNIFKFSLNSAYIFDSLVNKNESLSLIELGLIDLAKGFKAIKFGRRFFTEKEEHHNNSSSIETLSQINDLSGVENNNNNEALNLPNDLSGVENDNNTNETLALDQPIIIDDVPETDLTNDIQNELEESLELPEEEYDNSAVINQFTRIKRDTENILEERGTHVLYVVCGFFEWKDPILSDELLNTPLIFIPVTIQKSRTRDRFSIQIVESSEVEFNPTFAYLLKKNYGVDLDIDLSELLNTSENAEHSKGIQDIFNLIEDKLGKFLQGKVKDEVWLGKFWFEKLVLLTDIQKNINAFINDPIIQNICGEKPQVKIEHDTNLDELSRQAEEKKPAEIFEILDADSSQRRAIEAAVNKKNFVLIGPPGTGKSQTIANIIAECLVRGKKVLFVSEKLAALKVVKKKLEACNLGKLCISIHGKEIKKRDFYSSLHSWYEELFMLSENQSPTDIVFEELYNVKKKLNDFANALSKNESSLAFNIENVNGELLPYKVNNHYLHGKLLRLEDIPDIKTKLNIEDIDVRKFKSQKETLERCIPYKDIVLGKIQSDWFSTNLSGPYTNELEEDILSTIQNLKIIEKLILTKKEICNLLELDTSPTLSKLIDLQSLIKSIIYAPEIELDFLKEELVNNSLSSVEKDKELHETYEAEKDNLFFNFKESILHKDVEMLKNEFVDRYREDGFRFLKLDYWKKRKELSKEKTENINETIFKDDIYFQEIERAFKIKKLSCEIELHTKDFAKNYGNSYKGENTDWDNVSYLLNYAKSLLTYLNQMVDLSSVRNIISPAITECLQSKYSPIKDKLKLLFLKLEKEINLFQEAFISFSKYLPLEFKSEIFNENDSLKSYPKYIFGEVDLGENSLEEIYTWVNKLEEDLLCEPSLLGKYLEFKEIKEEAENLGLKDFLHDLKNIKEECFHQISNIFEKRVLELLLTNAEKKSPSLTRFSSIKHDKSQHDFQALDKQALKLNQLRILEIVGKQIKEKLVFEEEPRLLKKLGQQKRPKVPIRQAIQETKDLFFNLKPCWMMSPLSVSQYCPPNASLFDVVIFDEASQVRPADSIGAIFRGDQIIVVGDPRQLPPTNFFQTIAQDESKSLDNDEQDEIEESIIDEILSKAYDIEQIPLKWHYRSKSEDLFAFASHNIYPDLDLITFPNPKEKDNYDESLRPLGVKHIVIQDGVYDRGRTRTNQKEAEAVSDFVIDHYKRYSTDKNNSSYLSLGVIAFSAAQEDAILNALMNKLKDTPELESILEDKDEESFFIKNLETVQGDERDHIIISVGYGPDQVGKITSNFGPLNSEGGYRRLNVAITRARRHLVIVSSFNTRSINLNSVQRGPQLLLKYLRYAEEGKKVLFENTSENKIEKRFNSPFEEEVYQRLIEKGLAVHTHIGCSDYRLDMAVVNPLKAGSYLFAIECDGKTYYDTFSARDRDRLRHEILEDRGWKVLRVWSRDWMKSSNKEINKIIDYYNTLLKEEENSALLSDWEMNLD